MSFAEDQHPVGDLGPGGEHEPFCVGVRAGASGWDLHGLDAGAGQDRVEGFGELPGPVADQEPEVRGAVAVAGRSTVTVNLDGRATSLELARNGEPVLDAVLRARPDAPYACKGGVCGTCRAKLVEGTVGMERTYALEQDEIGRGYVLTCQSHPTSDTVVLDYDG
jgi:ferredoxin